jgi:nucleoside-diphosphate-sugar epimerase
MRVFVTGATGTLGRHLVPGLVAAGHMRLPAWLGRVLAGEFVVAQMTTSRGSSNEKARKELGWEPRYASWREGFRAWVRG